MKTDIELAKFVSGEMENEDQMIQFWAECTNKERRKICLMNDNQDMLRFQVQSILNQSVKATDQPPNPATTL